MARGRMLNRDVTWDGKVAEYGEEHGCLGLVFHHRIIAFLDVNGNVLADPYWLKGNIMPRVGGCDAELCSELARGLVEYGMAVAYEVDGVPYLHFPRFRDNQHGLRVDREKPEVPTPQGFDDADGELPADFRIPAGYAPANLRNGAGKHPESLRPEVEVEDEVEVEGENNLPETAGADSGGGDDPATWMHEDFCEALGGQGRQPELLPKRRKCYRAMHEEQLRHRPDPREAWRGVLREVLLSDHHMSKREYQMPESLLRNAERRERWMLKSEERGPPDGLSDADRKIIRRRMELEGSL